MAHLDLFSGIAGFAIAARWTGQIDTQAFCEIDDFCRRVIKKNFPGKPIFHDIRILADLLEGLSESERPEFDIITGGFPCQDVSLAGKGEGIAGSRSGLWREYHRIIRLLRPRFAVVENVPGLRSRGMGVVLGDLAGIGYDAEWTTLSSCRFGAPQTRERVLIVSYPESFGWNVRRVLEQKAEPLEASGLCPESIRLEGAVPPGTVRTAYGIPNRLDRLRALGNAIDPRVAYPIMKAIVNQATAQA